MLPRYEEIKPNNSFEYATILFRKRQEHTASVCGEEAITRWDYWIVIM
jgi:hypothetical protein